MYIWIFIMSYFIIINIYFYISKINLWNSKNLIDPHFQNILLFIDILLHLFLELNPTQNNLFTKYQFITNLSFQSKYPKIQGKSHLKYTPRDIIWHHQPQDTKDNTYNIHIHTPNLYFTTPLTSTCLFGHKVMLGE